MPSGNKFYTSGTTRGLTFRRDKCIHEVFEERVAQVPDAVAVMQGDRQLTYGALNARANQLARHLHELGVAPDTRVAIGLERSIELVLAELAILKCGAAYVPLDQNAPIQRLALMIEDCQARVVVTTKGRVLPEVSEVRRLDVDGLTLTDEIWRATAAPGDSEAAAYVMYTSGSTGKPKGVEIPHRAIGRLVLNNGYADFQASDRIAFASNPAFDAATMEVWGALLNGGRVVVIDQATLLEPSSFARVLETYRVTTLFITTALFNRYALAIPKSLAKLRFLLCGGEQSEPLSFARLRQNGGPQHLFTMARRKRLPLRQPTSQGGSTGSEEYSDRWSDIEHCRFTFWIGKGNLFRLELSEKFTLAGRVSRAAI